MIPILSIVGRSNSGKTTLIERLLPELKKLGVRVGTIKHDVHGFEMDHQGKDTWRHRQSGADSVVIASSSQLALISNLDEELSLDELAEKFFGNVDLVLTEGYKSHDKPKIEVFRSALGETALCELKDNLIGLVTDVKLELDVPQFQIENISQLVEYIKTFIKE